MFSKPKAVLVAVVMSASALTLATPQADAAGRYYSSCSALHNDFRHGVAKSYTAAMKQVRQGYGRPAYGDRAQSVYWTNHSRLDRDNDGTACEA